MQATRTIPNENVRASVARALADYYTELSTADAGQRPVDRFSLARLLTSLHGGAGVRDGIEREICSGLARIMGGQHDPDRPQIPWPALAARDLSSAVAAAGGYLVASQTPTAVDVLRGFSVTVDAGITVLDGLVGNVAVPVVGTSATGSALATETSQAAESQAVLGQIAMVPKTLSTYCEFSRQLEQQVPSLEMFLRAHMLRLSGELLDTNVWSGAGASGRLLGITNTPGIVSQSGASLSWAGIRAMRRSAVLAGAKESELAWIGAAGAQEVLSGRERFTGAGAIWDDTGIGGRPAYPTKVALAGSLVVGPWASVVLGLWGGVQLEVNPYAQFQNGIKGARVMLLADLAVTNAGAFSLATSIT